MKLSLSSLALASVLALTSTAFADTVAYNTSGTGSPGAGTGLAGLQFQVSQNINVTQVGFYALSLGGGDTPHVAILNVTGGATTNPTVLFDTGALTPGSLTNDSMNYVTVGSPALPLLLTPGNTYQIVAPAYWVPQYSALDTAAFTFGPEITSPTFLKGQGWGDGGWDNANTAYDYANPPLSATTTAYVTANFQYTLAESPIPEPASLTLLALGGLALISRRRRTH